MRRLMHVLASAGLATIGGRRRCVGPGIGQGAQARWHSQLRRRRRAPRADDCHASTTFGVSHPVSPHYSTLLKYTGDWKDMRIEPDAASSWSSSADGLTFTFKLRQDVKFHDGSPTTSADVKATYDRIINPQEG